MLQWTNEGIETNQYKMRRSCSRPWRPSVAARLQAAIEMTRGASLWPASRHASACRERRRLQFYVKCMFICFIV